MDDRVDAEWLAAVEDSGLSPEKLRVHAVPGQGAPDGRGAIYWSPDSVGWSSNATPVEMRELVDVLGPEQGFHRFGIWKDHPRPVLAALLRHELEHARQWTAHGLRLFHLHDAMRPALYDKADGLNYWGFIVNVAPIELDANAAAARFVWDRYPEEVEQLLEQGAGQHEPLFRYRGGPEPIETLPERTVRFAHLFADRCERTAANQGRTFADVLEERWPGAAVFWHQLSSSSL